MPFIWETWPPHSAQTLNSTTYTCTAWNATYTCTAWNATYTCTSTAWNAKVTTTLMVQEAQAQLRAEFAAKEGISEAALAELDS